MFPFSSEPEINHNAWNFGRHMSHSAGLHCHHKLQINLIFKNEVYLELKGYQGLAKFVQIVNKPFTNEKFEKTQLDLIHASQARDEACDQVIA